ncbi:MAG: hypothetical protein ACLP7O_14560 [Terracidiphilus sp.]
MNESAGQETKRGLNLSKQGAKMPFLVLAIFWDRLLFLLTFSLVMMGMSSPLVILIFLASRDGRLERLGLPIVLMILSMPAVFLCTFIVTFLILLRRRLKTGSFLLPRERLNERVARSLKPQPLRKRITIAALYWFFAIGETYVAVINQHHPQFNWGLAAFIWLVAVFFTVDVFRPFARKRVLPATPKEPQTPPVDESR